MLLAFLFIFRNDLVHADGTSDAMGADTREYLLPGRHLLVVLGCVKPPTTVMVRFLQVWRAVFRIVTLRSDGRRSW
jgi:hypothetical protein